MPINPRKKQKKPPRPITENYMELQVIVADSGDSNELLEKRKEDALKPLYLKRV